MTRRGAGSGRGRLCRPATLKMGVALTALALLAACTEEARLPGERLDPMAAVGETPRETVASGPRAVAVSLPGQSGNAEWPQRAGGADHDAGHVALSPTPRLLWKADIGTGVDKHHRILAEPVVGGGRIFALDARAMLTAVSPSGQELWSTSVVGSGDKRGEAPASGIAYAAGQVFVTTGYGELVALDAQTGTVTWRQSFDSGISGAPTVADGTVYVATGDSKGHAVRAADGRVLWQIAGIPSVSGIAGVSAPAVSGDTVVFAFDNAGLVGTSREGARHWVQSVAGKRVGLAYANVSAVTGDPVIASGTVYAGTSSGRISAFSLTTGQTQWSAGEGAYGGPVALAGNAVFASGDDGRLVRLDRATGKTVWAVDLPYYTETKDKKRRDITVSYGPVLAGGRLFLASTDGKLRAFDPASGSLVYEAEIPGGAAAAPAVAGQTLYVVSRSGQLLAFR